jgi:hypothetical protein
MYDSTLERESMPERCHVLTAHDKHTGDYIPVRYISYTAPENHETCMRTFVKYVTRSMAVTPYMLASAARYSHPLQFW